MIYGFSMSGIYADLASKLLTEGREVTARGMKTIELTNIQFTLHNPRNRFVENVARDMDMKYCMGELCYFLDGRRDLSSIAHYSKFWNKVSDDGKTVNSAYGFRLFNMIGGGGKDSFNYCLEVLLKDPSSRKAVMPIYDLVDSKESNDNPCTMFGQFLIRDNKLCFYVFMRSNDIWLGTPYDVAFFTVVQEAMFVALKQHFPDLRLGKYVHTATSLHVYEKNIQSLNMVTLNDSLKLLNVPFISIVDVENWFNDLLTYEKSKRGVVTYKDDCKRTSFQDWCKLHLS